MREPWCAALAVLLMVMTTLLGSATATFKRTPGCPNEAWNYANPSRWADLCPAWAACAASTGQSPRDIRSSETTVDLLYSSVRLAYNVPPVLELFNNSHAIEAHWKSEDATSAALVTGGPLGGAVFKLEQLHFHAPSEHRIDGRSFPLEVHFVHTAASGTGQVVVISLLVEAGDTPSKLLALFDGHLNQLTPSMNDSAHGLEISGDTPMDAYLQSEIDDFYYYNGSTTTPPCAPGTRWIIAAKPVSALPAQLAYWTAAAAARANNRPVQSSVGSIIRRSNRSLYRVGYGFFLSIVCLYALLAAYLLAAKHIRRQRTASFDALVQLEEMGNDAADKSASMFSSSSSPQEA